MYCLNLPSLHSVCPAWEMFGLAWLLIAFYLPDAILYYTGCCRIHRHKRYTDEHRQTQYTDEQTPKIHRRTHTRFTDEHTNTIHRRTKRHTRYTDEHTRFTDEQTLTRYVQTNTHTIQTQSQINRHKDEQTPTHRWTDAFTQSHTLTHKTQGHTQTKIHITHTTHTLTCIQTHTRITSIQRCIHNFHSHIRVQSVVVKYWWI